MLWSFAATVTFRSRGWVTVGAVRDGGGISFVGGGEDNGLMGVVRWHPVMVEFLRRLGFCPAGVGVGVGDITDLVLSFRALEGGVVLNVVSSGLCVDVSSNDLEVVCGGLVLDAYFMGYVGCFPLGGVGVVEGVVGGLVPVVAPVLDHEFVLTSQAVVDFGGVVSGVVSGGVSDVGGVSGGVSDVGGVVKKRVRRRVKSTGGVGGVVSGGLGYEPD